MVVSLVPSRLLRTKSEPKQTKKGKGRYEGGPEPELMSRRSGKQQEDQKVSEIQQGGAQVIRNMILVDALACTYTLTPWST